jgi:dipeptidyl-peptidase-4
LKARSYRLLALCALCAIVAPLASSAAPAPLKIDEIFSREPILGRLPAGINWAPDGSRFLYTLPGGQAGPLDTHVYDVKTNRDAIFFVAKAEGKGARPAAEIVWSPDSKHIAYLNSGDLWTVASDGTGKTKLATGADDPQWSPDSRHIGFVHKDDVYAVAVTGGAPVRYSTDGNKDTVNGDPDWAYSEELGLRHAYRWAPDSARIAYLRFDQRPITKYPIVDFLDTDNTTDVARYPLAGEKNSIVTLRVADTKGKTQTLYSTKAHDDYIASAGWTPAGVPTAVLLDRSQKRLRYVAFAGGAMQALVTESDPDWVDLTGEPKWLADKQHFLFLSDRDGEESLYVANAQGGDVKRLTHGYRVSGIAAVDASAGVVYADAAWPTRRDATVLAIPLAGGDPKPLATGHGAHRFFMASSAHDFVRSDSAFGVPPVYSIGNTATADMRPFAQSKSLADRGFGQTELLSVDSKFGKLDAWIIKPPNFDPSKTYPVIMQVYGGPASPTTSDSWGGETYLYHQALAQNGFIVFSIDGPGSQTDKTSAVRTLYHSLGPASLAGQLEGVAYLKTLPYVDSRRIGIWGWSFGGYETTYALTHAPGVWKVGVAVAPVTDWKYYDSIYTERYMGTPKENPIAYTQSSVLDKAGDLQGSLLISHGTSDDNVHMANTISLVQAFILSGKQIDMMVYPRKTHGISGIPQRRHLFTHMLEYWQAHL